jgi:DNA polymerase-4
LLDLRSVTRSITLPAAVSATTALADFAEELVRGALADFPQENSISLLAISVSNLEQQHPSLQLELPFDLQDEGCRPGTRKGGARWVADCAVDKIRNRFGQGAVGYGALALGVSRSVPDEFRELAEEEL